MQSNQNFSNVILSVQGLAVSNEEKAIFKAIRPVGIILFARNIQSFDQVKKLCDDLKSMIDQNILILIDQEGGRVMRIKFGICGAMLSPAKLMEIAHEQNLHPEQIIRLQYTLSGIELQKIGINVNCVPCADMLFQNSDNIVGDRSFGGNTKEIINLCKVVDDALASTSVQSVLKHIPGHGRALVDSHKKLPIVDAPIATLEQTDFVPFKALSHIKMAMTAHIVYTAIDKNLPATTSKIAIKYIRQNLNYKGILLTDDLSMKALSDDVAQNFADAINAGVDIGLYCFARLDEMKKISDKVSDINPNVLTQINQLNCFNPINPKIYEYQDKMAELFNQMVA